MLSHDSTLINLALVKTRVECTILSWLVSERTLLVCNGQPFLYKETNPYTCMIRWMYI